MLTARSKPHLWIIALLLMFLIAHLRLIGLHCFSYYDLGIYSEALRRITLHDLNPFIPGRNIKIFSDHFDPLIIPFSFFENWISAPYLGTILDTLFIALCWIPIKKLSDRAILSPSSALFSFAFLVLNQATIDALNWPFHPTTWGFFPLVCVLGFYLLEEWGKMILSLILLFACREEFPLIGPCLALVLFWDKKRKPAFQVTLLSALWIGFTFFIRPRIFGDTSQYGRELISSFLNHPFAPLSELLSSGMIRMALTRLVPLFLVLNWEALWKHRFHFLKILIITAPIFGVRYVSGQWAFHYGTAAVIAFFFACLPGLDFSLLRPWRKKLAWAIILTIFMSPTLKDTWDGFFSQNRYHFGHARCPLDSHRLTELETAQEWIHQSQHQRILTLNSLAPEQLIHSKRNQEVNILGTPNNSNPGTFDVVLVEKPPRGDGWLVPPNRIFELIEIWKRIPGVRVITDNDVLFLAEGPITPDR